MLRPWSTYAVIFWSGGGSGLDNVLLHLMSELIIPSGKVFRLFELFSHTQMAQLPHMTSGIYVHEYSRGLLIDCPTFNIYYRHQDKPEVRYSTRQT